MSFVNEGRAPKILACFFVYNEAAKILQAIEQMQKQTYPCVEVAIFDNCSTDGTVELIERLKDPKLTLFKNPENQGSLKNFLRVRDYAIRREDCEYFLLADVEDWYHENYFQALVELLEKNPRAVGAIPSCVIHYTDLQDVILREQHCSYELLFENKSLFRKAFHMITNVSLQYCMIWRSLVRRSSVVSLTSEDPLFQSIEEFAAVLAVYLGGIVTTSKLLHVKYQVQASLSERGLDSLEEAFDFSSFEKKWKIFVSNVAHTFNLEQLSLFAKIQILILLFYRLFMRYTWVSFVQGIKHSRNPFSQLILIVYQPIRKLKQLVAGFK